MGYYSVIHHAYMHNTDYPFFNATDTVIFDQP